MNYYVVMLLFVCALFCSSCAGPTANANKPLYDSSNQKVENNSAVSADTGKEKSDKKISDSKEKNVEVAKSDEEEEWEHEDYGPFVNFIIGSWSYVGSFRHWVKSIMPSWWYNHNEEKNTISSSINNKDI